MDGLFEFTFTELLARGGPIMWPLAAMSVIAVTLIVERYWFWFKHNNVSQQRCVLEMAQHIRLNHYDKALALASTCKTIYGQVVINILTQRELGRSVVIEAVETQRPRVERFMSTLSTIITAAPMLGILGTVLGIISSFQILGDQSVTDPRLVSQGIASALLTTAAGLLLALMVLLPYNTFRTQMDRTWGRIELLIAAAEPTNPPKAKQENS